MQILIAAVGKAKRGPEAELVAHYLKQTRWNITLKEIPDAPSNLSSIARAAREGKAITELLTDTARLVVLDSRGKQLSSPQIAQLVSDAQQSTVKTLVFAIGGQDGLPPELLARAHTTIAFGTATWPHQLLRAMLSEQLYRAYSITIGHPYHIGH